MAKQNNDNATISKDLNKGEGNNGADIDVLEAAKKAEKEIAEKAVQEPVFQDVEDWMQNEIEIDPSKRYVFELLDTKLTKHFFQTQEVIYDPIQKRQVDLKYSRAAQSVLVEHQNDTANADRYEPIVFEVPPFLKRDKGAKAKLEVMGTNKNLILYLLLSPYIEGSKTKVSQGQMPKFRLIDIDKMAKAKLSEMEIRYKAIELARSMSDDKLASIAYVMGVTTANPADLKVKAYQKIEEKPLLFIQLADDTSTPRKYAIKKALDNMIISATLHPNKLYWVDSQAKITDLDPTQDVVEYVSAWSLSTDEGQEFYTHLRRKIS